MKKLLFVMLAAVAIITAGCSEQSRAKASAKKYFAQKSNDGKIEIVEVNYADYTFEPDKFFLEIELKGTQDAAEQALDQYKMMKDIDLEEAKVQLEIAEKYTKQLDSLENVLKNMDCPKYILKKGTVKARGKNALGVEVLDEITGVYWTEDLKKCSLNPSELIDKK